MAKKKRNEEEIEKTAEELPLSPPEEVLEKIKSRQTAAKFIFSADWVYDPLTGMKERSVLVRCTSCGSKFHLPYSAATGGCHIGMYGNDSFGFIDPVDAETKTSGSTCICPCCGMGAEALHVGRIYNDKTIIETTRFVTLHNVRGHLAILSWILEKNSNKDGKISYRLKRYEGVAIIDGMTVRYVGYQIWFSYSWFDHWEARARYCDTVDRCDPTDIMSFTPDEIEGSEGAKSAIDVFIKEGGDELRLSAYLHLWTRYPAVENLVRSGYSRFLSSLIEEATGSRGYSYNASQMFKINDIKKYIDVKKKKPHEMLGIEKEDMHLARELTFKEFCFYRYILETQKLKLDASDLKAAVNIGIDRLRALLENPICEGFSPPIVKTIHYLTKTQADNRQGDELVKPSYLRDYWSMLVEFYGELSPRLLFPKDIRKAHDYLVLQIKEKTDKETDENIKAYASSLEHLSFADEETGLCIRACANQTELIKEGKILNHCVARYAKSYSERKTAILFIRKLREPEIPYYTLEFKDGTVIQNRGKSNCARTNEVKFFEEKWLEYIKNPKELRKKWKTQQ